jgi:dienelactone hydrolase
MCSVVDQGIQGAFVATRLRAAACSALLAGCGGNERVTRDAQVDAPVAADVGTPADDASVAGDVIAPDGAIDCAAMPAACEYTGQRLPVACVGCAGTRPLAITDPMTGRVLPILIRYPQRTGTYPVVVWSHGGGLLNTGHLGNEAWGDTIAAAGYVVVHLAHVTLDTTTAAALCTLASVPTSECRDGTDPNDTEAPFVTIARPRDVIAVLDQIPALVAMVAGPGRPTPDPDRVIVAGWSGGSRAPSMLFGATRRLTASIPRFTMPDRRPIASVMVSPAGPGYFGYFNESGGSSYGAVRGPVLVMTGDNDVKNDTPGLTGAVRRMAFDLQPADGTRRLLFSRLPRGVGGHETFNLENLNDPDPRVVRLSRALRATMLAFLDATARQDPAAIAWLASDRASRIAGDAEWTRR